MNDKFKKLTNQLTNELHRKSLNFLIENLMGDEEETSDLINLILSSHLSSLFSAMKLLASEHKEHSQKVEKFINELMNYISSLEPITNVEVIT